LISLGWSSIFTRGEGGGGEETLKEANNDMQRQIQGRVLRRFCPSPLRSICLSFFHEKIG